MRARVLGYGQGPYATLEMTTRRGGVADAEMIAEKGCVHIKLRTSKSGTLGASGKHNNECILEIVPYSCREALSLASLLIELAQEMNTEAEEDRE
jgi:hypothetical protein